MGTTTGRNGSPALVMRLHVRVDLVFELPRRLQVGGSERASCADDRPVAGARTMPSPCRLRRTHLVADEGETDQAALARQPSARRFWHAVARSPTSCLLGTYLTDEGGIGTTF